MRCVLCLPGREIGVGGETSKGDELCVSELCEYSLSYPVDEHLSNLVFFPSRRHVSHKRKDFLVEPSRVESKHDRFETIRC